MSNTPIEGLSAQTLRRAAKIKARLESLQVELSRLLGASSRNPGTQSSRKRKRRMSAEGRARIAAAQKARWAKVKALKK